MNIKDVLNWRYTTKSFDPNKKISPEDLEQVKSLLQMSPSSTNLQPWHFIIAGTEEGKQRFTKSTQGFFIFNEPKVLNASHVVAFCSRTSATDEYMRHLVDKEDDDGRYAKPEFKEQTYGARNLFADIHRYDVKDFQHWMEKQVYLNIGNFLLGVAAMGIDAAPMEGFDMKAFDEEFGLRQKGFTAVTLVALGYRSENDFNAKLPKSRLDQDEILTLV
ncbi:oxygen-insensitive NAD(P)H nitroreductase [Aquimarina spongiae]|uniref:Nitroreductase / dihydropteridine reductase n=1 Tax=Aquimarina spongiae TaxID=570521 RepID=A0A1M6CFN5_9FLAO|nr:oxygen-insensitive NAD(P)H nitroreductase [Aquimarina spongiae]SHI59817.1 nitroreductase / dihydropteridine reductase [Aquimarina spongiae]